MGSQWRESVHGAIYNADLDPAAEHLRATALLAGIDPTRAIALVRLLAPLARARLAADLPLSLEMARALQPDLIVAAADIAGHEVGEALLALNTDPALEDIPVIVLGSSDDDSSRISALRGGALAWLPHTVDDEAMLARVRLAVRLRRHAASLPPGSARR